MNGKISKKLRRLANQELKGLARTEQEIIDGHANLVSMNPPKFVPERVWKWIVKKIIYR